MVKRTSCLASNEMFQVRILVELLDMVSVVYAVGTPACEAGQCLLRRSGFNSRRTAFLTIRVCSWESSQPPTLTDRVRILALVLCRCGRSPGSTPGRDTEYAVWVCWIALQSSKLRDEVRFLDTVLLIASS